MGRLFIQYCEDDTASRYTCLNCGVDVANNSAVIWSGHMGRQKPAFLLRGTTGNVVPISKPRQERLHTGLYTLQTLGCRCCATELGWLYVTCHGHAEHLYKQGCSLLEQAALRASPSRLSLANARQELRKMQQGHGGTNGPSHRPARHLEGGSSYGGGSFGSSALLGAALQGLHRSGNPPPVSTADAPFLREWSFGGDRMLALQNETDRILATMQDHEEGPSGQNTGGRGMEEGDAGARGTTPPMPFPSLEDVPRQPRVPSLHEQIAARGGPHTRGQVPPPPLTAAEHLARSWIRGRTQVPSPPRPSLQHMLSLHLEALERAPSGSSPAAVAARQAALTEMNQALNALHNHEQHSQHEMEAMTHDHRGGQHVPGPMSGRQEEGTDEHDEEELPEAREPDEEEAFQHEAAAVVAAFEEVMGVMRSEQAVVQTSTRGAPPVGVLRRLFPDEEHDAEAMDGDPDEEEEEEEGNREMEEGDEGRIGHSGVLAVGPGQEGGVEGEEVVDEDLGIVHVEQQRDEAAGSVTLGETQQSHARLEQLMIDDMERMDRDLQRMAQDQDSDLERVLHTTSRSHNSGGAPIRVPPPLWLAGRGLMSRQAQQHRLDHHLAERQFAPPQRVPGYRMPPFLTRSLRRNGGPSGGEARIAWPATAASERRREISDGGREGMRGVEAPGAGAEPIPCLPRSIQPLSLPLPVAPPLDRHRSPL